MRSTTSRSAILCALVCSLALGSCIETRRRKPAEQAAKSEAEPATGGTELVLDPTAVDGKLDALIEGDRVQALYDADDPAEGAKQPLVTIIEYSDFECPFCGRLAEAMTATMAANPEDVRIVFKEFPLPMHARAEPAARAALAAHAQGKFWQMHDLLFRDRSKLGDADFESFAKQIGLDVEKFRAAMRDDQTQRRALEETNEGRVLQVQSTPTFFVNGRKFEGAKDAAAIAQIVDEEKLAAQKLLAAGAKRNELYAHFMHAAKAGTGEAKPIDTTHKRGEASRVPNYAVPIGPGRPTRGPEDALVTVVEFGAFGCASCAPAQTVLAGVLDKHPEVRHAFRQLPDVSSEPSAKATIAAGAQGKFWELHDALAKSGSPTDAVALRKLAGTLAIDLARYDADIASDAVAKVITEDRAVADKVRGTAPAPIFFVNGRFLPAEATADELEALIKEERAKAEQALTQLAVPAPQLYEAMRKSWRGFAMIEEAGKDQAVQPGGVAPAAVAVPAAISPAPVRGDASKAKVTIVACTDFDCPACARGAKLLADLAESYGDALAIELRHYSPNPRRAGEVAQLAAMAAERQGKLWELYDELYENRSARSEAALEKLATAAGLDIAKWNRDRSELSLRERITADSSACTALGVNSLPSYVIGETVIRGAQTRERFAKVIDPLLGK